MKTPLFIRIRKSKGEVTQICPDKFHCFMIEQIGSEETHILSGLDSNGILEIYEGTFSKCHEILNKINELLDSIIIDV